MQRFYSSSQNISADKIIISDKSQAHHIRDVLRLKIKDRVVIFDEQGNEYISVIENLSPQKIIFKIKEQHNSNPAAKSKITVACAIPKKCKIDDIIDKLTQLSVNRIIPLETARVVVKLDKQKKIARQERWEKIALNASQQSQRHSVPVIDSVKNIEEVIFHSRDYDLKIIPTLIDERKSLQEVFKKSHPKNTLILIGPEGDFTPKEVNLAKRAGFIPVTLGDLVLRVETAAIAVVSFMRLHENR